MVKWIPFPWGKTKESVQESLNVEEYVENLSVGEKGFVESEDIIYVKPMNLDSETILEDVEKEIRKGNIVVLDIGKAMAFSAGEAYKKIKSIKKLASEIGGDVCAVAQNKVMVLPEGIEVAYPQGVREEENEE